jgi:hypothetical protein
LSRDDFYAPTDLDMLRMENELLAFEVRFLRAHLGLGVARRPGSLASPARLSYLEEAERDLVLLLRRMSASPLGPVLRVSGSFRTLVKRYLDTPEEAHETSMPERVAYLEGAESDLVLLLRRMSTWPLGPLFRIKDEFRTLEERYL